MSDLSTWERRVADRDDLAFIPDGAGYVVGIIDDVSPTGVVVRWGDSERLVCDELPCAPRLALLPSAGSMVGKRYDSLDDVCAALEPHYREGDAC